MFLFVNPIYNVLSMYLITHLVYAKVVIYGQQEGDLRLVDIIGDTTVNAGRLEIYYNNTWGTICDHRFDGNDANVACRQLGFSGTAFSVKQSLPRGTGIIWLHDIKCIGNESKLIDCNNDGWKNWETTEGHKCNHNDDIGISCFTSELSHNCEIGRECMDKNDCCDGLGDDSITCSCYTKFND
eukprot:214669_1